MKLCDARIQGVGLGGRRIIGCDAGRSSRDDLAHLTPAEISRALELGQLRALLNPPADQAPAVDRDGRPTRAGLAAMTPAQIAAADRDGQLAHLLTPSKEIR